MKLQLELRGGGVNPHEGGNFPFTPSSIQHIFILISHLVWSNFFSSHNGLFTDGQFIAPRSYCPPYGS